MTDGTGHSGGGSNQPRQVINIQATDGGVAAYHIDTVLVEGLADLRAATTVLPIEAMADVAGPFVGRNSELRHVGELLSAVGDAASSIVVVSGPPGVGKTALVRQASNGARDAGQFDHVLFVDLRGYEPDPDARVQPDAVLPKLLLLLGIDDSDIAADPAAQAVQYQEHLNLLASQGKSVLLWLDNVSDRSQFDSLRPVNPGHQVVVTTRETFGHIPRQRVVDVDLMSIEEAVALLAASARNLNPTDQRFTEESQAVGRLAQLCDRLPLALQIVAALLADEPDRPISEMVDELTSEEDRLNSLEYSGELSVRAAFALSYKRLREDLQRLFRLLSVVPGGDIGWEIAGLLIGATPSAVRPQLMALVRSHLVQQHVRNRWSMHDLIRLYSIELSAAEPDDAAEAFTKITRRYAVGVAAAAEWLTAVVSDTGRKLFSSPEDAAVWFEAERPTVIAIVMDLARRPDQQRMLLAFTIVLGELLKSQRHWLKDFHDVMAVGATAALGAEDKHAGACVLNLYGAALRQMGRYGEALDVLQRSLNLAEENGDVSAAGGARSNMANVFFDQGRVDEALELYWEDVRKCREAVPPHRYNEAGTLSNIGAALAMNDRFAEAIAPLREAMEIRRQLGDLPGIASSAKNLGGVLVRLGREENSREHLEQAVDVLVEAAGIYRRRGNASGTADIANNLGQAQCMLRRFADGIPNLEAALEYFERSDQKDLAAQVRDDLEYFRQRGRAQAAAGAEATQWGPWSAEHLGNNRFCFTNTSGGTLAMIVLFPIGTTQVRVEDGVDDDPHVVPSSVAAGASFVALVRGSGIRVTATAMPSMTDVYWDFTTS